MTKTRRRNVQRRAPRREREGRGQRVTTARALARKRLDDYRAGRMVQQLLKQRAVEREADPVDRACAAHVYGSLKPVTVCGCGLLKPRRLPLCRGCREVAGIDTRHSDYSKPGR